MAKSWFTLTYDEVRGPAGIAAQAGYVRGLKLNSVADAVNWAYSHDTPTAWLIVAEYTEGEDGDELIGQCALDEAEGFGYETLDF